MANQVQACFSYFHGYAVKRHLTSLVLLFLTVLPVFLGHLPPLTSNKFLVLILFSVLVLSVQLPQLFGTPFLAQSIHPMHLILFGAIFKHFFQAAFNNP